MRRPDFMTLFASALIWYSPANPGVTPAYCTCMPPKSGPPSTGLCDTAAAAAEIIPGSTDGDVCPKPTAKSVTHSSCRAGRVLTPGIHPRGAKSSPVWVETATTCGLPSKFPKLKSSGVRAADSTAISLLVTSAPLPHPRTRRTRTGLSATTGGTMKFTCDGVTSSIGARRPSSSTHVPASVSGRRDPKISEGSGERNVPVGARSSPNNETIALEEIRRTGVELNPPPNRASSKSRGRSAGADGVDVRWKLTGSEPG